MTRVLVTCPPMLAAMGELKPLFDARGVAVTCPPVVQTLDEAALMQLVPEHDGWIAGDDPVNRRVLAAGIAGRLRAVVKWGVGVDNVDFAAARDLGVPVANTPGMFNDEVADVAMAYVTALARGLVLIDRDVRQGGWTKPPGVSLAGKTVALVGFGNIGRECARRFDAARMRTVIYDPAVEGIATKRWPEGIEEADFMVFTAALTPENHHMLNAGVLARTKHGVRIVNVARGPLIDERALCDALTSGAVAGAALDVFEEEPLPARSALRAFDQCILGSHNSSNTMEAVRRTSEKAVAILFSLMDNGG